MATYKQILAQCRRSIGKIGKAGEVERCATGRYESQMVPPPSERFHRERVGAAINEWNEGQGSAIYKLGSSWYANQAVPIEIVESAKSDFESLLRRAKEYGRGAAGKLRAILKVIRAQMRLAR